MIGHYALVAKPRRMPREACLALVLVFVSACGNGAATSSVSSVPATDPSTTGVPTTTSSVLRLSDADLADVLAVAIPAAIAADPDGFGKVVPTTTYVIADSFGQVNGNGWGVSFSGESVPLSSDMRAAVEAALSPATAAFVPADLTKWMLLIAEPTIDENAVIVTYEQRCGGEPDALCGSGGAFRVERIGDGWTIAKVVSQWIS